MADDLIESAEQLGFWLQQRRQRLVTAESCTGGWIAESVTAIAGSSAWFDRGFITYSNPAKIQMLGVKSATLEKNGAVSLETAKEMAFGALAHSEADYSIAVTGIAGPDGGSTEKPVGTVYIAWANRNDDCQVKGFLFDGNRRQIRFQTVQKALHGLLKFD